MGAPTKPPHSDCRAAALSAADSEVATKLGAATTELVNHGFTEQSVQMVDFKQHPGAPFAKESSPHTDSIEVDDDAINSESPIFPPNLRAKDPEFGAVQKDFVERVVEGNWARAEGRAAVGYLRARGWDTAADIISHYLANESGGRDPSMAKPFRLSAAQTDALADEVSGYRGSQALPGILENARQTALANAARSGQSVYTEVAGSDPTRKGLGKGWNPVGTSTPDGTSSPDSVYALGRYSVQVVTQVETGPGQEPVIRQRYFAYDYTDYAHSEGSGGAPLERAKRSAIDALATLRDIGWARGFDTTGTSSIRTYRK